jgi:hypothetical protein
VTIYGAASSSASSAADSPSSTASTSTSSAATPKKHHKTSTATASASSANPAKTTKKKTHHPAVTTTITVPAADAESPPAEITVPPTAPLNPAPITITKSTPTSQTQMTISAPAPVPPPDASIAKPEVDTGLPIARPGSKTYHMATFPLPPVIPVTTAAYGQKNSLDEFPFSNFPHTAKNSYPWKINIVTTIFWIGEGSTPISTTDNVASAWDEDWRGSNGGTDTPNARDGFAPAHHIATINPFYVALPFNDLAFPDKARRWLPAGWSRPPRNGKPVSACQHRWVEIKNAQGDVCYAQWEDVGPLRYDHAEYVFGDERPDTYTSMGIDHAGLDVSPAVADYLGISDRNHLTRWRFVDDADVQPGAWLKYDEEALLFKAIRDSKDSTVLPIERARAPINDQDDIDANQKKVSKAKG